MFITLIAAALAAAPAPARVVAVASNPDAAAELIEDRGRLIGELNTLIKSQNAELARTKAELDTLKAQSVPSAQAVVPPAVPTGDSAVDKKVAKLKESGLTDKVTTDVATRLLAAVTSPASRPTIAPAVPQNPNPCMGHAWIVGKLNDPNGYGPGGAFRCHSDTNPKSFKFINKSDNYGFVVVVNGLVVVPQTMGRPALLPTSGVPWELRAQIDATGIGWLPMIPPGEVMYGSSPSMSGTWRLYRFLRDPVTGTYELDEACETKSYDLHGRRVDWEEWLGDNMGYCD